MAEATDPQHARPEGTSDAVVEAVGKVSEALEKVERARGRLYDFHQLIGAADFLLGDAADELEGCGHPELAAMLRDDLIGRNVLHGRWTFQVVEEFDDLYYWVVQGAEERVRNELMGGRRHVYESELKEQRRSRGVSGHEARPDEPYA
jgi:hypothetical protein